MKYCILLFFACNISLTIKNKWCLDMGSLVECQSREYSSNPLNPLHKTDIIKDIRKLQRLSKSAKGAETKAKHKAAISELKKRVIRYKF